jgi:hypothetical protein
MRGGIEKFYLPLAVAEAEFTAPWHYRSTTRDLYWQGVWQSDIAGMAPEQKNLVIASVWQEGRNQTFPTL